jgi:hypothetical protein
MRLTARAAEKIGVLAAVAQTAAASTTPGTLVSIGDKVTGISCLLYKAFVDIGGALASLVFLLAAVKWVASRDDPQTRIRQRETMMNVIIGLTLLVVVKTIVLALAGVTEVPEECM